MEGPQIPGYYPSVTGVRPPGERLRRAEIPSRGPIALVGEVHRYGPGQRRFWLVKFFLGLPMDTELVWRGPERPVPPLDGPIGLEEHQRVSAVCMAEAKAKAERFEQLDPKAKGGLL